MTHAVAHRKPVSGPRIVVIGGGTGSFTLLSDLKYYVRDITALVNMVDDGGSTGQLRDEYGVLPPGDVRQCLVALSNSPRVRDLFNYRFDGGTLTGHSFGNLFLTALEKVTGNFAEAVEQAGEILRIDGTVVPMTLDNARLVMARQGAQDITGQRSIEETDFGHEKYPQLWLEPAAQINPAATRAIEHADIVVIAPGNLYTSIAPALLVRGVREALAHSKATRVYVCNLVTKPGQTDGFTVSDYAAEIERFAGVGLDYVIYNNKLPTEALLSRYAHDGEFPVTFDEVELAGQHYTAKGMALVADKVWDGAAPGDPLASSRTLIRHNADRVARELMRIYFR